MTSFIPRRRGEKCNGLGIYIYHFYSLAVEASFYGDTGRVVGFFYKVKQHTSRLVPGWVTVVLDFTEDLVSRYTWTPLEKAMWLYGLSIGFKIINF